MNEQNSFWFLTKLTKKYLTSTKQYLLLRFLDSPKDPNNTIGFLQSSAIKKNEQIFNLISYQMFEKTVRWVRKGQCFPS